MEVSAVTSVVTVVVITGSVKVSIASISDEILDGVVVVVILASVAISNIFIVVSSMTISEVSSIVEGKVSVEVTVMFVDISVIISGGTLVIVESVDISVVMSGNIRDSEGKVEL